MNFSTPTSDRGRCSSDEIMWIYYTRKEIEIESVTLNIKKNISCWFSCWIFVSLLVERSLLAHILFSNAKVGSKSFSSIFVNEWDLWDTQSSAKLKRIVNNNIVSEVEIVKWISGGIFSQFFLAGMGRWDCSRGDWIQSWISYFWFLSSIFTLIKTSNQFIVKFSPQTIDQMMVKISQKLFEFYFQLFVIPKLKCGYLIGNNSTWLVYRWVESEYKQFTNWRSFYIHFEFGINRKFSSQQSV